MTEDSLLKLNEVWKSYGSPGTSENEIIKGISFDISRGDTISIAGPSGSGKSTLLNLMGILDTPTRGSVIFDGRSTESLNDKEQSLLRNSEIGFVFQLHHLLPQCTVLENVLMPTLASKQSGEESIRALNLLEKVGLADKANSRPGQLSGGECQRAAVVRALINQPKLLLADEPTGSLDSANSDALADLFLKLNEEESVTLVLVTHSEHLAEKMNRKYLLADGRLQS